KGADEGGARLRREQRLGWRENEGHVDANALARQRLAGTDPVSRQRHLYDHVLINRGDLVPLPHHAGEVGRGHFAAHRTLDDVADFLQDLMELALLLRKERRIRRHSIENTECGEGLDVLDAAGIDKDLHNCVPASSASVFPGPHRAPVKLDSTPEIYSRAVPSSRFDIGLTLPARSIALTA